MTSHRKVEGGLRGLEMKELRDLKDLKVHKVQSECPTLFPCVEHEKSVGLCAGFVPPALLNYNVLFNPS